MALALVDVRNDQGHDTLIGVTRMLAALIPCRAHRGRWHWVSRNERRLLAP